MPVSAPGTEPDEALRVLRSRIDLARLPRLSRDVTEQVILASADFDYSTDLRCDEDQLAAGAAALAVGVPVIADSTVVAAAIAESPVLGQAPVICKIGEPLTTRLSRTAAISPAAAAVRLAFGEAGPGAFWIAGGAAAGLAEILARRTEPSFVIGLPAGFTGAAEAKDALRATGVPAISNLSEKGGPMVAAAAFGALLAAALTDPPG